MSLRFLDSFDHYLTADILEKWTATTGVPTISAGNGRRSTAALECPAGGVCVVTKTLDAQQTWIMGCALRLSNIPATSQNFVEILDGGTVQLALAANADATLSVLRGSTEIGRSTATLFASVYMYVECKVVIHNTTGSVVVRLDGIPVLSLGPLDTQQTANSTANQLRVRNLGATVSGRYDDLYICDGTGATHTDFLGDCRVDCLFPNGDGSNSAWTPSTGTTHSTLVDEATPNDDTDYLSTLTVAARETHVFPDLPAMTNPSVLGVQHCISARKDDVGTRQLKSVIISGATTQVGPTTLTIASAYAYYLEVWPTDPATGLAWTIPAVNALEAGFDNLV